MVLYMRIKASKSKNSISYSIIKDIIVNGKRTTKIVEKIGNEDFIRSKCGGEDIQSWLNNYLTNYINDNPSGVHFVKKDENKNLIIGNKKSFNGGYLFLQDIYYKLGLDNICNQITDRYQFKFDLNSILSNLIYSRIIYPSSKLKTLELCKNFIEQPNFDYQHILRALEVISKENDFIQSELYKNSLKYSKRNDKVLFYDCTNYYFEIEDEDDFRKYYDKIFYKERWIKEDNLEQRLIITFSPKYQEYQKRIREKQITRALSIIEKHPKTIKSNNENDPKRFIENIVTTVNGEIAEENHYSLDKEKIDDESKYDGLYAVCTNLEDSIEDIIKINKRRWEIEESFRIMKSEFNSRPIYLSREDRIKAHFTTCFLSLIIYRYLEKRLNEKYTTDEIISLLKEFNFLLHEGEGYEPLYTASEVSEDLCKIFTLNLNKEIINLQNMKKIFRQLKK